MTRVDSHGLAPYPQQQPPPLFSSAVEYVCSSPIRSPPYVPAAPPPSTSSAFRTRPPVSLVPDHVPHLATQPSLPPVLQKQPVLGRSEATSVSYTSPSSNNIHPLPVRLAPAPPSPVSVKKVSPIGPPQNKPQMKPLGAALSTVKLDPCPQRSPVSVLGDSPNIPVAAKVETPVNFPQAPAQPLQAVAAVHVCSDSARQNAPVVRIPPSNVQACDKKPEAARTPAKVASDVVPAARSETQSLSSKPLPGTADTVGLLKILNEARPCKEKAQIVKPVVVVGKQPAVATPRVTAASSDTPSNLSGKPPSPPLPPASAKCNASSVKVSATKSASKSGVSVKKESPSRNSSKSQTPADAIPPISTSADSASPAKPQNQAEPRKVCARFCIVYELCVVSSRCLEGGLHRAPSQAYWCVSPGERASTVFRADFPEGGT